LPSMNIDDLITRVLLLAGVKLLRPTLSVDQQETVSPRCAALNRHILRMPSEKGAILASPVLGAGVELSILEKAFLAAYVDGKRSAALEALERDCGGELRGRSAAEVVRIIETDHLPIFRAMGLTAD